MNSGSKKYMKKWILQKLQIKKKLLTSILFLKIKSDIVGNEKVTLFISVNEKDLYICIKGFSSICTDIYPDDYSVYTLENYFISIYFNSLMMLVIFII